MNENLYLNRVFPSVTKRIDINGVLKCDIWDSCWWQAWGLTFQNLFQGVVNYMQGHCNHWYLLWCLWLGGTLSSFIVSLTSFTKWSRCSLSDADPLESILKTIAKSMSLMCSKNALKSFMTFFIDWFRYFHTSDELCNQSVFHLGVGEAVSNQYFIGR